VRHQRLHTGDTLFKCVICGKALSDDGSVVRYQRKHTDEKTLRCFTCGKKTSWTEDCVSHQLKQTGFHIKEILWHIKEHIQVISLSKVLLVEIAI
jgi:uncharacterized Zn-finger protein